MRATELLRDDHERVQQLFTELQRCGPAEGQPLLDEVAAELEIHAQLEEDVFYPALEAVSDRIPDARAGHEHVRALLAAIQDSPHGSADWVRNVHVLKQAVLAHVAEEESALFLEAARLGADELDRLGREMLERKQALTTSAPPRAARERTPAARRVA